MDMTDQCVLVTGASRGIGAAIADVLLRRGARVIGSYATSANQLDDLKARHPNTLYALQADLSKAGAARRLYDEASSVFGPITTLVNNAGTMLQSDISASDDVWSADWQSTMAVNVQAVADLCRDFIRQPSKSARRIITIASRAAHRGDGPDYMHYAASKGAVVALMKSIARGYGRENIFAFTISPGWVNTDMAAIAREPDNAWMLDEIPTGRMAKPSELANMVAFLSSGACDSATGATFDVNGASYVR